MPPVSWPTASISPILHLSHAILGGLALGDLPFERGGALAHARLQPVVGEAQRRLRPRGTARGTRHGVDERDVDAHGQRVECQREPAVRPGGQELARRREQGQVGGNGAQRRRQQPRAEAADEGRDDDGRQEQDEGELVGGIAETVAHPQRQHHR